MKTYDELKTLKKCLQTEIEHTKTLLKSSDLMTRYTITPKLLLRNGVHEDIVNRMQDKRKEALLEYEKDLKELLRPVEEKLQRVAEVLRSDT